MSPEEIYEKQLADERLKQVAVFLRSIVCPPNVVGIVIDFEYDDGRTLKVNLRAMATATT